MSFILAYSGKGIGMSKHQDEAGVATDAFKAFAQQFGPDDVYTRIILEVILEELFNVPSNLTEEIKENQDGTNN